MSSDWLWREGTRADQAQLFALQLVVEPAGFAAVLLAGLVAQPAAEAQRGQRLPFLTGDQVVVDVGSSVQA